MSHKQSKAIREALTRSRLIFLEIEKYLKHLPPIARITMGDMADEISEKFKIHKPDCRALISFYFHTKYEVGDNDFILSRGRLGGIKVIPPGGYNHGP